MKRFYLAYNKFTNEYSLDQGEFGKNRAFFRIDNSYGLIKKLNKMVNLERKSDFYMNETISENFKEKIFKLFENTKIEVINKKELTLN